MSFISLKSTPAYKSNTTATSWNTANSSPAFSNYPQYIQLPYAIKSFCVLNNNRWFFDLDFGYQAYTTTNTIETYDVSNISVTTGVVTLGSNIIPYEYKNSLDVAIDGSKAIIAYGNILAPPVVTSFNFNSPYSLALASRPDAGNSWVRTQEGVVGVYVNNTANMIFTCNSTHVHKYVANAYNLASTTFDSAISVGSITTNDLYLSDDGSKLYTIGSGNDRIYQYNLSTNWNISTATLFSSYLISSIDGTPSGLCLSENGSYVYFLGRSNGRIYRLELSVPFDISTASYSSNNMSIGTSNGLETGLRLKPGGSFIYYNSGFSIVEVSMPTPYSLSGASKTGVNTSTTRRTRFSFGLSFSTDGSHAYATGNSILNKINLTTNWNINTASFQESDESLLTVREDRLTIPSDNIFSARYGNNGYSLYILAPRDILQYDLSSPYNIGTCTYNTKIALTTGGTDFSITANKIFTYDGSLIKTYRMTNSWNVASAVSEVSNNFSISGSGMFIPQNIGNVLFVSNNNIGNSIAKYTMNTEYAPSSAYYRKTQPGWFSDATSVQEVKSLQISNSGNNLFYLNNNTIRKYSLTSAWNIETSTFESSHPIGSFYDTLRISYDGLNAFVGTSSNVRHLILSAPYNFSSYSTSGALNISNSSFYLNNQGTLLYILNSGIVSEYALPDRWNVSSASSTGNFLTVPNPSSSADLVISSTGKFLYHVTANTSSSVNTIQRFILAQPWSISSASFSSSYIVRGTGRNIDGLVFRSLGNEYYVSDKNHKSIYNLKIL